MKVQYAWVVTDASGYRYLSTMSNHRYEAIETSLKDDINTCSQVSIRSV